MMKSHTAHVKRFDPTKRPGNSLPGRFVVVHFFDNLQPLDFFHRVQCVLRRFQTTGGTNEFDGGGQRTH